MSLEPLQDLLQHARKHAYAVPAFCVWNAETMRQAATVAAELSSPVIVMGAYSETLALPPEQQAKIAKEIIDWKTPAAFILDHGRSLEEVQHFCRAGYTGVMLDLSHRPYAENLAQLRQAVAYAHPLGIGVEGELGHVGKADTMTPEGDGDSRLTDPSLAASFVAETGIDALAVSIGNAHGQYQQLPHFSFSLLEQIARQVTVPLSLHGGSGTSDDDIRRAVNLGIAKINVATELMNAYRETFLREVQNGTWIPLAVHAASGALQAVMAKWIILAQAKGKA
ncbi:MAG: class II fructose-bisphosphate aldolase [Lentisphaeria bacterium]